MGKEIAAVISLCISFTKQKNTPTNKMMKLYMQRPDHFFGYTARMTADYCGFPYELVIVDDELANDAAFKAKKAHHNFPMAETADGKIISQSAAIASYIAREAGNEKFLGETAFQQAEIEQ